jgi:hypothetical protein
MGKRIRILEVKEEEREDIDRNTILTSIDSTIIGYIRSIHGGVQRPYCRGWVGKMPGRMAA